MKVLFELENRGAVWFGGILCHAAAFPAGKTDTEALSGAFFFFALGQTRLFALDFLRIAKIHPFFRNPTKSP